MRTGSAANSRRQRRARKLPSAPGTCWRKSPRAWGLSFRLLSRRPCWSISASCCCRTGASWWCLVSTGGNTRDKVIRPEQAFSQQDLDHTAEYLNHHYTGFLLEAIRADLLTRLAKEEEQYALAGAQRAGTCAIRRMLGQGSAQRVYIEGAAQMAAAPEFTDQSQLRDVLVGDRGKAQASSRCWRTASIRRTRCTCRLASREWTARASIWR